MDEKVIIVWKKRCATAKSTVNNAENGCVEIPDNCEGITKK